MTKAQQIMEKRALSPDFVDKALAERVAKGAIEGYFRDGDSLQLALRNVEQIPRMLKNHSEKLSPRFHAVAQELQNLSDYVTKNPILREGGGFIEHDGAEAVPLSVFLHNTSSARIPVDSMNQIRILHEHYPLPDKLKTMANANFRRLRLPELE